MQKIFTAGYFKKVSVYVWLGYSRYNPQITESGVLNFFAHSTHEQQISTPHLPNRGAANGFACI